jgi:hypothetical protein
VINIHIIAQRQKPQPESSSQVFFLLLDTQGAKAQTSQVFFETTRDNSSKRGEIGKSQWENTTHNTATLP